MQLQEFEFIKSSVRKQDSYKKERVWTTKDRTFAIYLTMYDERAFVLGSRAHRYVCHIFSIEKSVFHFYSDLGLFLDLGGPFTPLWNSIPEAVLALENLSNDALSKMIDLSLGTHKSGCVAQREVNK